MENASKALIIAGAILLAILLISLGIMIFTQAQDTINTSGMSQTEVQTFNSKFLKYEGDKVKGAEVKALVNEVFASNAANTGDPDRTISVTLDSNSVTNSSSDIKTNKTYEVKLSYAKGLVHGVALKTNP